jgi:hypothetical protein
MTEFMVRVVALEDARFSACLLGLKPSIRAIKYHAFSPFSSVWQSSWSAYVRSITRLSDVYFLTGLAVNRAAPL